MPLPIYIPEGRYCQLKRKGEDGRWYSVFNICQFFHFSAHHDHYCYMFNGAIYYCDSDTGDNQYGYCKLDQCPLEGYNQ